MRVVGGGRPMMDFITLTPHGPMSFRIDPANVEKFVADLKSAYAELTQLDLLAREIHVSAPGNEGFSAGAAKAFNDIASEGDSSHRVANEAARKTLQQMIENVEKSIQAYRSADSAAEDGLRGNL
jgi:hypothetical protein